MKAKNVTREQMFKAINVTNKQFKGNIIFAGIEEINAKRTRFNFRLSVFDSRKAGARLGITGRRIKAACWHVHGTFFDNLLEIAPEAEIRTCSAVVNKNGGNWQDKDIGSIVNPFYYSEACDC